MARCCSMEGTTQRDGEHHDRSRVDSTVPMRDLVDSYMPAFQACVERGQVAGLMCGCETRHLLPLVLACFQLDVVSVMRVCLPQTTA